jgi:hypothetical protein
VWVDDSIPSGAVAGTDGEDVWNWVNSNPSALHGSTAHQSSAQPGLHQHFFSWASNPLQVNTGDVLFSYVYLDPANPPSELMLQWVDGSWEHRAYWGANNITYGVNGTVNRAIRRTSAQSRTVGLPAVPASLVGLEGSAITGMSFSQFDGRATWDYTGKSSGFVTNSLPKPILHRLSPPIPSRGGHEYE